MDDKSEWSVGGVSGEVYLTHLHRKKCLELQARLNGVAPPDALLVAAEVTEAFVKSQEPATRRGKPLLMADAVNRAANAKTNRRYAEQIADAVKDLATTKKRVTAAAIGRIIGVDRRRVSEWLQHDEVRKYLAAEVLEALCPSAECRTT
ncbi:hypothetical protein [Terricaulis sp.]|uniref:hypothetical protein n=1 Tax=Terricaulis sp. TaxID=2768686 RepID=UPI002ADDFE72|nr:hypothetical protein [Terricaulis sp.]